MILQRVKLTFQPLGVGYANRPKKAHNVVTGDFFGEGFRPWQAGEARSPKGTREISRDQGLELSDAVTVPQHVASTREAVNTCIVSSFFCFAGSSRAPQGVLPIGQLFARVFLHGAAQRPHEWSPGLE